METQKEISIGDEVEAANGLSWMQHEWSTSVLDDQLVGWDWDLLRLDDGRELNNCQLRTTNGKGFETSEGTLVDEIGSVDRLIKEDVEFNTARVRTSPGTDASYQIAWTSKFRTRTCPRRLNR